ncbi:MAG: hypothetical protein LBB76_07630 [Azoarcus sp.]|jgi:hypothetical protein|nr:hypothetical protein [Azoarcus sp.]
MHAIDDLDALAAILRGLCTGFVPLPGHAPLLDAVRRAGGPELLPRVSRGGWFRPGRIIDAQGQTVAEQALAWLETAWAACGEDGGAFAEEYAESGLALTLEQGISHYFVAPTGAASQDFLQLEVEELLEVVSHPVGGQVVDAVEFLLDHPHDSPSPRPIGAPRYIFRRLIDVREIVSRLHAQAGKPVPVLRFIDEWASSSAGHQRHFSAHWVLAIAEHLDRYHQLRLNAVPVAVQNPHWLGERGARGTALAQQLHAFDHAAGYGFAWYFHLVSGHRVSRDVLPEVFADLQDGMAYLPERDAALVHGWMRSPYSV